MYEEKTFAQIAQEVRPAAGNRADKDEAGAGEVEDDPESRRLTRCPSNRESDLHWTAFLYISGELPPRRGVELRASPGRRPARPRGPWPRAVELATALAVVGPEFRPKRRPIVRRVLVSAVALAAAACLVLAVSHRLRPIPPAQPDASAVALAWSSLRGDSETTSPASATDPVDEIEADAEVSSGRPLPSWLLTAASAPVDDALEEED